jgi:hypothetical protein
MRRQLLRALVAGALLATTGIGPALSAVDFDVHFGTRSPRVYYRSQPRMVIVPGSEVYYVEGPGYDMFRYGSWWYINEDGAWYRARSYRGPYYVTSYQGVPRQIIVVPDRYHHHPFRPNDRSWKGGKDDYRHDNGNRQGNGKRHRYGR